MTSLEEFTSEVQRDIITFTSEWLKKHEEQPDLYPLTLPPENEGLWFEFFINYMTSGEI